MTLPWVEITLEEIADIQTGSTPSKKSPQFYGGNFPLFKPGDLGSIYPLNHTEECLSDEGKEVARFVPANSTYVTCIGATIGKTGFVNVDATCNQQINTLSPVGGIYPKLIFYWMISPQMNHRVVGGSSSTTMPIINKTRFSKLKCALPPLAEQKVIADKLDTLLAQVETTKARLERIPQILKTFRQSVLADAVSGKLTNDSTGTTKFKLDTEEWSIPSAWAQVALNEIINPNKPICYGVVQPGVEVENGKLLIRVCDIYNGKVDYSNLRTISDEIDRKYLRSKVVKGDVLVTIVGAIGRIGLVDSEYEANIARAVAKLSPNTESIDPKYLHIWLSSPNLQWWLLNSSKEVARKTLNLKELKEAPVALPSLKEQTEIVRRVEELFAFSDSIEQKANAALERVNNLTQSILAKAFRGELTVDWRAANPELISGENSAEALLEKIKAEREAAKVASKDQKKSPRKAKPKKSNPLEKYSENAVVKVIDKKGEAKPQDIFDELKELMDLRAVLREIGQLLDQNVIKEFNKDGQQYLEINK